MFTPAARAIDGLEKALAGLGLLDDALALDYSHRLWSTGFRTANLVRAADDEDNGCACCCWAGPSAG